MLCVTTPATEPRLTPAARVTSAILEALKRGVRPWIRPWSADTSISLPLRANGLPYKGVNTIALWAAALERGFASPYWLTFKQAQALKAHVRKGERGAFVVYYGERLVRDEAAEETPEASTRTQRILRGYTVFCADQVEGLPEEFYPSAPASKPLSEREAELLQQLERIPAIVRHGGNRAYYAPASDAIHLALRESFADIGAYLITTSAALISPGSRPAVSTRWIRSCRLWQSRSGVTDKGQRWPGRHFLTKGPGRSNPVAGNDAGTTARHRRKWTVATFVGSPELT